MRTRGPPRRVTSRLTDNDDGAFHVATISFGQSATVGHVVRAVRTRTQELGPSHRTPLHNSLDIAAAAKSLDGAFPVPNSLDMPSTVKSLVFY